MNESDKIKEVVNILINRVLLSVTQELDLLYVQTKDVKYLDAAHVMIEMQNNNSLHI